MQITTGQKTDVLDSIKNKGFTISGYCRVNGLDYDLFYKVLSNKRGQTNMPSPASDEIISVLQAGGYLEKQEAEAEAT